MGMMWEWAKDFKDSFGKVEHLGVGAQEDQKDFQTSMNYGRLQNSKQRAKRNKNQETGWTPIRFDIFRARISSKELTRLWKPSVWHLKPWLGTTKFFHLTAGRTKILQKFQNERFLYLAIPINWESPRFIIYWQFQYIISWQKDE